MAEKIKLKANGINVTEFDLEHANRIMALQKKKGTLADKAWSIAEEEKKYILNEHGEIIRRPSNKGTQDT